MKSLRPHPTNRRWPRDRIASVCRYPRPRRRRLPRKDRDEEKRPRTDFDCNLTLIVRRVLEGVFQHPSLASSSSGFSVAAKRPARLRTSKGHQPGEWREEKEPQKYRQSSQELLRLRGERRW